MKNIILCKFNYGQISRSLASSWGQFPGWYYPVKIEKEIQFLQCFCLTSLSKTSLICIVVVWIKLLFSAYNPNKSSKIFKLYIAICQGASMDLKHTQELIYGNFSPCNYLKVCLVGSGHLAFIETCNIIFFIKIIA